MTNRTEQIAAARARRLSRERRAFALTDLGNAERLVHAHGEDIRHVAGLGWYVWDGRRWMRDETGEVMRRAKQTVRTIYSEAKADDDADRRKAIAKHAGSSESKGRLEAMVSLAKTEATVALTVDKLDSDAWALNCTNGTIDLRTGKLRPHRREDLITKLAPVDFDPTAPAPLWEAFLARVVPSEDVRAFLRRWAGYSLTASAVEHALAFMHGGGQNGKGVYLNTLRATLGDYAVKAPRGLLTKAKGERHPTDMMVLLGARLAWCSETNANDTWDEAKVKDLASEDPITAHYMCQDNVTWMPTHKLWIAGNHRPRVDGTDDGIWRRLRIIPFDVVIPEAERDSQLAEKLAAELPGILSWAVRGCLEWQAVGLGTPPEVAEATRQYRQSEDVVGRFVEECCSLGDGRTVRANGLYQAFCRWCRDNGESEISAKDFLPAMLRIHGVTRPPRDKHGYMYRGIGLVVSAVEDEESGGRWRSA